MSGEDSKYKVSESFSEKLLLEGFRENHENFRWYANARITINRFFILFFVAVSGLLGYILSLECPIPVICDNREMVVGIISIMSSLIGFFLVWANVCYSFGLADSAWCIEYYQRMNPILSRLLSHVKDSKYPRWINPNRLQIACMLIIAAIFAGIGFYCIWETCWLTILVIIGILMSLAGFLYYILRRRSFRKGLDKEFVD